MITKASGLTVHMKFSDSQTANYRQWLKGSLLLLLRLRRLNRIIQLRLLLLSHLLILLLLNHLQPSPIVLLRIHSTPAEVTLLLRVLVLFRLIDSVCFLF